jgi:hypothetical protein
MLSQIFEFKKKCLMNDFFHKNSYSIWKFLQYWTGRLTSAFTALVNIL